MIMKHSLSKQLVIMQRDYEAIRLRNEGASWVQVAETLGYSSVQAVQSAIWRRLKKEKALLEDEAEFHREMQLKHLDELAQACHEILDRKHIHVTPSGKIVRDDSGEIVSDDMPSLAAVDRLLKIDERRARLLGIDAPIKVKEEYQVTYVIEGVDMDKL